MSYIILVGIIVTAIIVVSACMLSSQISQESGE